MDKRSNLESKIECWQEETLLFLYSVSVFDVLTLIFLSYQICEGGRKLFCIFMRKPKFRDCKGLPQHPSHQMEVPRLVPGNPASAVIVLSFNISWASLLNVESSKNTPNLLSRSFRLLKVGLEGSSEIIKCNLTSHTRAPLQKSSVQFTQSCPTICNPV